MTQTTTHEVNVKLTNPFKSALENLSNPTYPALPKRFKDYGEYDQSR